MGVRAPAVAVRAPWRPGHGRARRHPLTGTAVRVWEAAAPDPGARLEGILGCDANVDHVAPAQACALQDATRWLIEAYHQAITTGRGAERRPRERAERLVAALALLRGVALRLRALRDRLRRPPHAEADPSGLRPLAREVVRVRSGRQLSPVRAVALALGRLGGHLNRQGEGVPGWQPLWPGMTTLPAVGEGVLIAHRLKNFG